MFIGVPFLLISAITVSSLALIYSENSSITNPYSTILIRNNQLGWSFKPFVYPSSCIPLLESKYNIPGTFNINKIFNNNLLNNIRNSVIICCSPCNMGNLKTEFIFENKIYMLSSNKELFFLNDMWLNFKFNISLIIQFFSSKYATDYIQDSLQPLIYSSEKYNYYKPNKNDIILKMGGCISCELQPEEGFYTCVETVQKINKDIKLLSINNSEIQNKLPDNIDENNIQFNSEIERLKSKSNLSCANNNSGSIFKS